MADEHDEDELMRLAALKNAQSIFLARQRAERELLETREALERKTEELAQQREWFRVALSSIGDGVIVTDREGKVRFLNPVAERLTGWIAAEANERPFREVFPIFNETTGEPATDPIERVLRERVVVALGNHTVLRPREGREIPVEDSAAPIFDENGEIRGVILVFHDVTEKHASQQELREAEWRARTALEVGNGGAWVLDVEREIVRGDAMVARSFNVPPERCREGEPLASFIAAIHEEDRERVQAAVTRSVETGEPFKVEFRALGADGMQRWLDARVRLETDAAGAPERIVGVVLDTTSRKQAEAELLAAKDKVEAASRAKDNFLAALSHELRTPLAPVLMTATALREDERLPADTRAQLGMMERNIAVEARLIDDLLDLTRVARGKLPLHLQLCDIHSLIRLAVEIVRDETQTKGIAVEQKLDAVQSGVIGDPARFQQVMWNLLRNAVKCTPAGGRIEIHTANTAGTESAPGLRIEVRDTGIGIEEQFLDQIFQAFEQGGQTGDHRFGGLGLGLSIARAIVDMHGGTIHAESPGLGRGATFIIELPDATEPPGIPEPSEGEGASLALVPGRPLRLLVVEDHRATREVLKRLLNRSGHYVAATESVATALAAAAVEQFDAVISDLGLPDGTGNELMMQLRERHGLRGIALSGYGMEKDTERSRESGFVAHLIKPVDFNQLRRTLDALG
jgi:PAS domain S-box-containing protein